MAREKKKSDWDAMQDLLSASQDANDWGADVAPDAFSSDSTNDADAASAVDEKSEETAAEPVPKKTSCRTKKAAPGAKTKTAKSRKKAAPKSGGDAVAAALLTEATPTDVETLDVSVGGETPKKRRRTASKKNVETESESDLVKNVLKLEQEEKEKAKKRARSKAAAIPFAGLLSQIGKLAGTDDADAQADVETAAVETAAEPEIEIEFTFDEAPTQDAPAVETADSDSDAFSFDFFGDETVETLDISWGKPARVDAPVEIASEPQEDVPAEVETPVAEEKRENEGRPSRRDRDSRRRRRDDAPKTAAVDETPADDAPVSLDLNDLEAFFGTPDSDEGVGFSPRRAENASAPKTKKTEKTADAPAEKSFAFDAPTQDAADEEEIADRSRRDGRNRRRRRGDRREFEDAAPRASFDENAAVGETPVERASEPRRENRENRNRRERDENREFADESRGRNRRERRPRPERDDEANVAASERENAVADDEQRRVLPSWNDAISYVVRFNMSRRTNRRK